jgi:phospholipase D1/2
VRVSARGRWCVSCFRSLVSGFLNKGGLIVGRARTIALALLSLTAIAIVWAAAREHVPDPRSIFAWFASIRHAWYALPLVAVAFAFLGALLVPVMLLIAATGMAFGPWLGPVYALTGSLASASLGFGIGRWIGRERVERLIGRRVPKLGRAMTQHGTLAVFFIRKIPLPFMLVNIAIGASPVRYRDFVFGTMIGMTAAVIALAGFGGTLMELLRNPSPLLIGVAIALMVVPILGAWALNIALTRRMRPRSH